MCVSVCVCVCVCVCVYVCVHAQRFMTLEGRGVREKEREEGGGGGGAECACYGKKRSGLSRISSIPLLTTSLPPQFQLITTPLPPFLKAAGLQTVKVQSDRGPQPTGHYALTIQNCDLIK